MKYNIWIEPHMPTKEELEPGYVCMPRLYLDDKRLCHLDRQVYTCLYIKEQIFGGFKGIEDIIEDIKTHPDKDEKILDDYLKRTGKTIDVMTDEEWDSLPEVELTAQEVKESLDKLLKFGYIEKEE